MKLFGSITELVKVVLRKSTYEVTIEPSTASANTTFQLPAAGGGTKALVTTDANQTLTTKTIDGDDNTIQDVALTSLKTALADANKVIRRNASGVVVSDNSLPNSSAIVTVDATQSLTNKSLSDSTTAVVDVTDATKQIKFAAGGTTSTATTIAAAQTANRTLTLPDVTGTILADTNSIPVVIDTSSSSDALRVTQRGAGNSLVVEDNTNPDATPLVVDSNGLIITGAATSYNSTAVATSIAPKLQIHSTTLANAAMSQTHWSSSTPYHTFNSSFGNALGTHGIVTSTATLGAIQFNGSDGISFVNSSQIQATADGSVSTGVVPGRLRFFTSDAAGTSAERMRIDSAGRLYVGPTAHNGPALAVNSGAGKLYVGATTYTDTATAASGTVTHGTISSFDNPAIAATNSSVTYTNASTVYIDGAPTGGTNVTITNPYALYVAAGKTLLDGGASIKGDTSGTSPWTGTAGYINETKDNANSVSATTSAYSTAATVTLTTGVWLVSGGAYLSSAGSSTGIICRLQSKGATTGYVNGQNQMNQSCAAGGYAQTSFPAQVISLASGDTKTVNILAYTIGANDTVYGYVNAVRIA